MTSLLKKFGLIIEYRRTEVFHFSRLYGAFDPLLLDLTILRGLILQSKNTWWYLGFIFDSMLIFMPTGDINNQIHENAWTFFKRSYPNLKETLIQILCLTNRSL